MNRLDATPPLGGARDDLARRLTSALMPDWESSGLEQGICEQILADALGTAPPPRTLRQLAAALVHGPHHHRTAALELTERLRRRAALEPDLPVEELLG